MWVRQVRAVLGVGQTGKVSHEDVFESHRSGQF